MIDQRLLLDDGAIAIYDVHCHASTRDAGPEEAVATTEVNLPLAGVFVRSVRRPGRTGAARVAIADPARAMVFRRQEPYRVTHPVEGHDRTLVLALSRPPSGIDATGPDDRPISQALTLAARRLAADLAQRRVDALDGAERAMALVEGVGIELDRAAARAVPGRDLEIAHRVRLDVAVRLGDRRTLPELGREVGLSGWELARRFRRATGTSIHAYRTRLRVQAALERVEAGERDLTGLALDLGFADHSHLTNVVRRATGAPPSAFRQLAGASREARTILQA